MNVSYRHFYPGYNHVVAAVGLSSLSMRLRTLGRVTTGVLSVWYIIGALAIAPTKLSYFSELVGAGNGYRYLVDYARLGGRPTSNCRPIW